ncbi:hypothetical protein TUBRATIS_003860 [Tubulinosema ratisbonensis]|uniref:Uncharacterized protein n=1 Tax=Tubulinosema ratisbonensis TaxID=291195 RepID=A0A437APY8_9MICR|nr:hypothetical protein TUBRATIS_003860 [Tubulinosema ratisbonensis]
MKLVKRLTVTLQFEVLLVMIGLVIIMVYHFKGSVKKSKRENRIKMLRQDSELGQNSEMNDFYDEVGNIDNDNELNNNEGSVGELTYNFDYQNKSNPSKGIFKL